MEDDFDKALAVLLGMYLLMVFYNNNHGKFATLLLKERGYLEFVLALGALYYITKYDKTGVVAPFVALSGLGLLLYSSRSLNLSEVTQKFANGELSLFGTIGAVLKG